MPQKRALFGDRALTEGPHRGGQLDEIRRVGSVLTKRENVGVDVHSEQVVKMRAEARVCL